MYRKWTETDYENKHYIIKKVATTCKDDGQNNTTNTSTTM